MNDLLEDQKIHYIVKDYRRMYNQYWSLRAMIDELTSTIQEKDKEILILRARVNDLKKSPLQIKNPSSGKLKGIMNEIESQSNSVVYKLNASVETINKISKNVEELRQLINV